MISDGHFHRMRVRSMFYYQYTRSTLLFFTPERFRRSTANGAVGNEAVKPLRRISPGANEVISNRLSSGIGLKGLGSSLMRYFGLPGAAKGVAAAEARSSRRDALFVSTGVSSALSPSISLCKGGMA